MARGNSLYAKLTRDLMPQYCKRIISDDETIQMLLSMLYQHTGIDYGNKTKAYSEGYEVGRVETRRAYEGKRYTETEMDKHGQYKYQEGYAKGIKDSWDKLTGATGYTQCYEKGIEEGAKGKEKFATDRAEEAYSKGYRIGLGNGIKQGKKEVVDFINNMKVSQ